MYGTYIRWFIILVAVSKFMGQYHFWNILITMMQCKTKAPIMIKTLQRWYYLMDSKIRLHLMVGMYVQVFIEINCSFFNKEIMAHLRQNFYWRDLIFSSSSKIEKKTILPSSQTFFKTRNLRNCWKEFEKNKLLSYTI